MVHGSTMGTPELARRGPAGAGSPLVLLVVWVAAFALVRGVTNIVLAFRVRELQHAAAD